MHSNLMSGLRPLMPFGDAQEKAFQISCLIDGLWLRLGLTQDCITSQQAVAQVTDVLPE